MLSIKYILCLSVFRLTLTSYHHVNASSFSRIPSQAAFFKERVSEKNEAWDITKWDSDERDSQPSTPQSELTPMSQRIPLSKSAENALETFNTALGILGGLENGMNERIFNSFLDHIDYIRDRTGLFQGLISDCAEALGVQVEEMGNTIKVEDIRALYYSDQYHLLDSAGKDAGASLMKYAGELFEKICTNNKDFVTKEEFSNFFQILLDGSTPIAKAEAFFESLDNAKNGRLNQKDFVTALLKVSKPSSNTKKIPPTFTYKFLDPGLTTDEEFVTALEEYCLNHEALNHHFLENLSCAAFGKEGTAMRILELFSAYQVVNTNFKDNVRLLMGKLEKKEHIEILQENLKEENGIYPEEDLHLLWSKFKISKEAVEGIPHSKLYTRMVETMERSLNKSVRHNIPHQVVAPMKEAIENLRESGVHGLLAMLYFGSEFIVPKLYSSLLQAISSSMDLTNDEKAFLILHTDVDQAHAEEMRKILLEFCQSYDDRLAILQYADQFLQARVDFLDALIKHSPLASTEAPKRKERASPSEKSQSKPRCMLDFTGRPLLYEMCNNAVQDATILDIGCGDGLVSRHLMSMGASKVVGVDISEDVIDKARMKKGEGEYFATGDAQEIKDLLIEKHGEVDLMLGSQFEIGAFDLCTAVFLFNYMSINSMRTTMRQVFSLLKPGGEFVFSVPHPNMVQHHSTKFAFDGSGDGYFSMRDRVLNGRIHTADGTTLNVHMVFKTLEDYISAITSLGFVLVEMKEARVDGMDQLLSSASDVPLHLIFRVKKPSSVSENASLSSTIGVDAMPKSLIWSKMAKCNFESFIRLDLPEAVNKELCEAALKCYENNVPIDSVTIGRDVRTKDLSALRSFCAKASNKMRQSTGALLIKGLDMEILGGDEDYEKMEKCGKIAYYIFCEHMGTVDGAARGKLFDVKSAKLDAMCQTGGDNVLFSVSDIEAGWHTDGASKDRVYDIVALFCINQAHSGGKFKISNACNAYHDLLACLPDFLTYELQRPIPRDILENGAGKGSDDTTALSRAAPVLANRIRYNAYPIYSLDNDRMRFRYMRHWIETGHKKTDWKVPTLLRIAMDVLDDKLDASKTFNQRLERGDMIFANNALIAHARDSFKDHPDHRPRHLVRAWIQSH